MTIIEQHRVVSRAELDALRQPRTDIVAERADGPDRFALAEGPFQRYERTLSTDDGDDDRVQVVERIDYRLALPVWGWLFHLPVRRALRTRQDRFGYWWAPPDRLSAHATTVLGLLCAVQIIDGYLGTVLTQTLSFAVDEFGRGNTAQGAVFGAVRFGVLVTLITAAAADRRGRRPLLLFTGVSSCTLTLLGGLAPGIWTLGASQLFARGFSTALGILIAVMAVEEMPARSRAWAASVLTMSAGLGSGMAVWLLPVADLDPRGWRIIYLVGGLGTLVVIGVWRRLPETRRFDQHRTDPAELPPRDRQRRQMRLGLLGLSLFLAAVFAAPASGFHNEFLREERGFSGAGITLFTLVTATPIGIGVLVGGHLAETRGRRRTAVFGLIAGTVGTVASFVLSGPSMWLAKLLGNVVGAVAVPALAVYGPELFGTHDRSRANALIITAGVAGSALGLFTVGALSDRWGGIGGPITLLAIGPLLVAVLIATRYPETAGRELEELNPEDRA